MLGNSSRKYVSIYTSSANTVARAVEVLNSKIDSIFDLLDKCRSVLEKNAEALLYKDVAECTVGESLTVAWTEPFLQIYTNIFKIL